MNVLWLGVISDLGANPFRCCWGSQTRTCRKLLYRLFSVPQRARSLLFVNPRRSILCKEANLLKNQEDKTHLTSMGGVLSLIIVHQNTTNYDFRTTIIFISRTEAIWIRLSPLQTRSCFCRWATMNMSRPLRLKCGA